MHPSGKVTDLNSHKWALVVAHPGHELRAFHFVERSRPLVSVLTDGAGAQGTSRLADTTSLLKRVGASCGPVYGRFTDPEAYACLMAGDATPFVDAARQFSQSLDDHGITAVLTDAAEGYNPVHDVCRGIAEAGVRLRGDRAPSLFEVDLVGPPDSNGTGIRLNLDDAAFARKLDAVDRYPALSAEAASAFERHGSEAFRTEFLRRAVIGTLPSTDHVPYYERVGDERVQQGRYRSVLRYGAHVRPVLATLLSLGAEPSTAALSQ
jgi:hypothetical protein